jgi:hypothetical protein
MDKNKEVKPTAEDQKNTETCGPSKGEETKSAQTPSSNKKNEQKNASRLPK